MRSPSRIIVTALAALLLLPASASAQQIIAPEPPLPCPGCWWPVDAVAQLDSIEADIDVSDGVTIARYRFDLSNPALEGHEGGPGAEGRIIFPVPTGSSVTDLVLSGGPETLEGRLLDSDDATRIYEDIVRRLIDPALLRSLEGDMYEVRAFPVPAGEERQVSFTVTTPLLAEGEQALVEVPWSRMSPRPAAALVDVAVDVPWEVRSAIAPGFTLDEERAGDGQMDVAWESPADWSPDTNFRLYLSGGEGLIDTRLLAYRERGEDGYFSLLFAPIVELDESIARDVVLVLDRSGSMEGEKMEQAISAAEYVLGNLGSDDRFAIVDFSRYIRIFDEAMRPSADAEAGIDYVRGLAAGGNTNIAGALERGLAFLDGERPGTVIFLTDGLATVGIEQADGILEVAEQAAPDRTQLFAFGVGYDVDTVLLDALANTFTGSSHYVSPEERIDTEVARLWERVSTPVLSDVEISIDGVETWDLAPAEIPGIFAGNQALLAGRYDGAGEATLTVTGNSAAGPEEFVYDVTFPERDEADPAVAQLWAQRRVADLLTELRIEGVRDSLIEEIVEVANQFGIVTPYTAYLAQEPEMAFDPERGVRLAADEAQAFAEAPASGKSAVDRAIAVEELRDGNLGLGTQTSQVLGAHTFYFVDETWTRNDFETGADAPEVEVGSAEFLALIAEMPEIAEAATLGQRVITEGPDGWIDHRLARRGGCLLTPPPPFLHRPTTAGELSQRGPPAVSSWLDGPRPEADHGVVIERRGTTMHTRSAIATAASLLVVVSLVAITRPVTAQDETPTASKPIETRTEVPEAGVAVSFPADWSVDIEMRQREDWGLSERYDDAAPLTFWKVLYASADGRPWCDVAWYPQHPMTLAVHAAEYEALMTPTSADVERSIEVTPVSLPAGSAFRFVIYNEPTDDYGTSYLLGSDGGRYFLPCMSDQSADDDWLSVAASIEWLAAPEPQ